MRCKEFEQDIYLYGELTSTEKANIDEHVKGCKECLELLETVQGYQSVIVKVAEIKPQPANHSRITSKIMQAVTQSQKQHRISSFLESLFLKYALVTASLVLMIFFAVEQQSVVEMPAEKMTATKTVILNSSVFLKTLQENKNEKTTSLYACLKSGDCNNTLFENLKKKKFNHENL